MTTLNIRPEKPEDRTEIATLIARTYMGAGARTIEVAGQLRDLNKDSLGFIAEAEGHAKAYALFTPLDIKDSSEKTLLLTPLAIDTLDETVDVENFLKEVILKVKESSFNTVVVYGSEEMYAPYGFKKAEDLNLKSNIDVADAVLMALEIHKTQGGEIIYPDFLKS